jgi:hypothetical protein
MGKQTAARPAEKAQPVRVEATRTGYYNYVLRYPADPANGKHAGDVFDLRHPEDFSERWMRRVPQATPKTPAPGEPDERDLPPAIGRTPTVANGLAGAAALADDASGTRAPASQAPTNQESTNREVI